MTPNDTQNEDLFELLLRADQKFLFVQWEDISAEIAQVEEQQQELVSRFARLDARRDLLRAVAKFRDVELTEDAAEAADPPAPRPKEVAARLIAAEPERVWDAKSLERALLDQGIETSAPNVRVILQRLTRERVARRVGHGRYQSASGAGGNLLALAEDES